VHLNHSLSDQPQLLTGQFSELPHSDDYYLVREVFPAPNNEGSKKAHSPGERPRSTLALICRSSNHCQLRLETSPPVSFAFTPRRWRFASPPHLSKSSPISPVKNSGLDIVIGIYLFRRIARAFEAAVKIRASGLNMRFRGKRSKYLAALRLCGPWLTSASRTACDIFRAIEPPTSRMLIYTNPPHPQ
jgi:hypothetical protein